jgi:hypothetical protein
MEGKRLAYPTLLTLHVVDHISRWHSTLQSHKRKEGGSNSHGLATADFPGQALTLRVILPS